MGPRRIILRSPMLHSAGAEQQLGRRPPRVMRPLVAAQGPLRWTRALRHARLLCAPLATLAAPPSQPLSSLPLHPFRPPPPVPCAPVKLHDWFNLVVIALLNALNISYLITGEG